MTKTTTLKLTAIAALMALAVGCFGLTACGGSGTLNDGTYTGQSEMHDEEAQASGYGVATVTIKDGEITDCTFETYELDGTLKDENYGVSLSGNENKYKEAQAAVEAASEYAKQLVEKGSVDDVDVISGATVNLTEFQEAVDDALAQARS